MMIKRLVQTKLTERLRHMSAMAILGPRQCGKTTLAKSFLEGKKAVYLDLEKPSDQAKLHDPETFFKLHQKNLICLDEIQRMPELFPIIRSVIDENPKAGRFLILGSASPELLRQSSETLAGRIGYLELSPFLWDEVADFKKSKDKTLRQLWLRGGFPRSFLAATEQESFHWREDFIQTFLERDLPQLGIKIPAPTLRRFWLMCAHYHGQILNNSQIGQSLGLSHTTIHSYVELLARTFVLRVLPPWHTNLKKRLIRSPKLYIRDVGILHALLGLRSFEELFGHPVYGASWEALVVENALAGLGFSVQASFYRTSSGAELDLVIEKGQKRVGIECKASSAPAVGKGFYNAVADLALEKAYIVSPVKERYPRDRRVEVIPLGELVLQLKKDLA